MPKKFGTNTKSQQVLEKREAQKDALKAQKCKAEEDAYWEDNDKQINKKLQRKDDKEAKKSEALERKQQLKKLHDEEMDSLQGPKSKTATDKPNKLTQAQIALSQQRLNAQLATLAPDKKITQLPSVILENPNRNTDDAIEARNVEDAIQALKIAGDSGPTERHPEKRQKSAYMAYEEKILPELRKQNPGMRLSQLKQLVFKSFQTAPENPKNQENTGYNQK